MGYVGNQTTNAYTSLDKQTITGDGGTSYTLDHAVANVNEIEVFVNNVRQEPSVAYTVSGTALTMTGNVAASDDFYVVFQGKAVQTVVPPSDSITTAMINDDAVTAAKVDSTLHLSTIKESTGTTTAITIDSSGRVLHPEQPSFLLQGNSAANKNVGDGEAFGATDDGQTAFTTTGNGAFIQGGMSYNSATGEITVPVAGVYFFSGTFYLNESNSAIVTVRQNNTIRGRCYDGASVGNSMNVPIVLNCAANDKISFHNDTGAARNFYEGGTHTYIYGHLVG